MVHKPFHHYIYPLYILPWYNFEDISITEKAEKRERTISAECNLKKAKKPKVVKDVVNQQLGELTEGGEVFDDASQAKPLTEKQQKRVETTKATLSEGLVKLVGFITQATAPDMADSITPKAQKNADKVKEEIQETLSKIEEMHTKNAASKKTFDTAFEKVKTVAKDMRTATEGLKQLIKAAKAEKAKEDDSD